MDVRQPALAADEHLPQRPAALGGLRCGHGGLGGSGPVGRTRSCGTLLRTARAVVLVGVGGGGLAHPRTLLVGGDAGARCARRCTRRRRAGRARTRPSRSAPKSQWPDSSFQRRSGSGSVRPSCCACGTIMSTNFWRRSSLLNRLMPQAIDCSVWPPLAAASPVSGGPNIISAGHHQRSAASWAMARWASVPSDERPRGSRTPAAGGTTPPCRPGSSRGRRGRRSSGTAAPGS